MKRQTNTKRSPNGQWIAGITLAATVSLYALSGGCGGSKNNGGNSLSAATRSAKISITWPALTRHIPYAADQIRITVNRIDTNSSGTRTTTCAFGDDTSCSGKAFVIDRDTSSRGLQVQDFILDNLPVGPDLKLVVKAYARKPDNTVDTAQPVAEAESTYDFSFKNPTDCVVNPTLPCQDTSGVLQLAKFSLASTINKLTLNPITVSMRPDGKVVPNTFVNQAEVMVTANYVDPSATPPVNNIVLLERRDSGKTNNDLAWTYSGVDLVSFDNNTTQSVLKRKTDKEVPATQTITVTYNGQTIPVPQNVKVVMAQPVEALMVNAGITGVPNPKAFTLTGYNKAATANAQYNGYALTNASTIIDIASVSTYGLYGGGLTDLCAAPALNGGSPSPAFLAVQEGSLAAYYAPEGVLTKSSNQEIPATQIALLDDKVYVLNEGVVTSRTISTDVANTVYSTTFGDASPNIVSLNNADKLAVAKEDGKIFTYVASTGDKSLSLYDSGSSLPHPPLTIPTDPELNSVENPAKLQSITDIAAEGHYLYVLDATSKQVHVFNQELKWLYSLKTNKVNTGIDAQGRPIEADFPGTPTQISATHLPNGDGVVLVAYSNSGFARYYRTRIP